MLCLGPLSSRAISALPDELLNTLSVVFAGTVTYEAIPYSPYLQLINATARVAYAMELDIRAVR